MPRVPFWLREDKLEREYSPNEEPADSIEHQTMHRESRESGEDAWEKRKSSHQGLATEKYHLGTWAFPPAGVRRHRSKVGERLAKQGQKRLIKC